MKQKLLIFSLLAACLLAACTNSQLKQAVKAAQDECPIDFGDNSQIEKVEIKDQTVVYTISTPEDYGFTVDQFDNPFVITLLKASYIETMPMMDNEALQQLIRQCHADSVTSIFRHVGKDSGYQIDVKIEGADWNILP